MLQSRVRRMLTRAAGPLVLVGLFVAMIGATVSLEADSGVGGVLTPEGVRAVSPGASTHPALPPIPEPRPQSTTLKQQCKDGAAVSSSNDALAGDCAVLLAAKDTLRGTGSLNWSTSIAISRWDGITLWGTPQRVDWITLRSKSLTGTIPPELGSLALSRLDLRGNSLTGSIPAELGNLTAVTSLYLHNNDLSGPIPAELGNMASLSELALFGNDLTGSIPPELSNLRRLRSLYLDDNNLSGSIPPELLDLPLRLLRLSDNPSLTGCVPPGLDDIASNDLDDLDLDECPSTYTLTTTAGANGSVSPSGTSTEDYADSVEITATPDSGYRVAGWSGACSAAEGTTCSVRMLDNLTVGVTFELPEQTLTVTVTGPGGTVTPTGATQQPADSDVTLTASWNDATHSFTGWSGDCVATTSTCVVTMDANKAVTATFAALPADRCATTTASDCIRAVYLGAPDDYAQVADVPADKLLTPGADGRYHVRGGQQYTVVTAAQLPTGWTRFYLRPDPSGRPSVASASRLIPPVGTTYTFTVSDADDAPIRFAYELVAARPFAPRPNKLEYGDVVVQTSFQTPRIQYDSFDSDGDATTAGSYSILMPDDDSDDDGGTTAVTTYEQLRTKATLLVVNETDGDGLDQSTALDAVAVGDVIQWGQDHDCWTRYQVATAPEPAEGATTRTFGVSWHMYSFSGCSGAVDASAATRFNLEPGNYRLTHNPEPIRYGPWQLHGAGWRGALEVFGADPDAPNVAPPSSPPSSDLTTVRQHALWRDPDLPEGWTLGYAEQGYEDMYGYIAYYGKTGEAVVTIQIRRLYSTDYRHALAVGTGTWKFETREIDGMPAYVRYANPNPTTTLLRVYDAATDIEYLLVGEGNIDLDQMTTIARSLWASE